MNLQGDFEGMNLTGIFQLLYTDQKTGFLRVSSDGMESRVYFNQGTIVYATSSSKKARLGFLMIGDGVISSKQLKESLALAKSGKLSLGKVLVDKGHISLKILEKYNTKQVEEIIYNLLFWKKGIFEYTDARLNLKGMIATQLNPMKLILEASRRMDEMSVLAEVIPSDRVVFKISTKVHSKEEFKLNANEWKVLSLIDGNRTVRQLIVESGYDEFAVYKILFSVISYGLIEKKEEIQLEDLNRLNDLTPIISVFDDIFQAISKNIRVELGEQTTSLFEECKYGMDTMYRLVIEGYHPDNLKEFNIQTITDVVAKEDIPQGRLFLIEAFSQYCINILKRTKDILGTYPLKKILNEIENVLGYIKKYQTGSTEKTKIISNMKSIMETVLSI